MPINANTFNSRVTSESLERKFRDVFPAQGGAELIQDLYAAGTIQPVIDFSSVAEGSVLAPNLQTAWDFSTGANQVSNATTTLVTTTGFWQVDLTFSDADAQSGGAVADLRGRIFIDDGATTKTVWGISRGIGAGTPAIAVSDGSFVVFLRSGDELKANTSAANCVLDVWYRQIADVNGTLVNPLGFTFS